MKPIYGNIHSVTGQVTSGICSMKMIPREWLSEPLNIDFNTNTLLVEPVLKDGKQWIEISFVDPTIGFTEKPARVKAGTYYETTISGAVNNIDAVMIQSLETLRYSEYIVIVMDKQGRMRIIGNEDFGMTMQVSRTETNDQGGTQAVSIELTMENEFVSPFYIEP